MAISIYNETKAAWGIETLKGSVVRFTKTKEKRVEQGPSKKRIISVITYTPLFESLEQLKTTLAKIKQTAAPTTICEKSTAIIFNNKEFKPIINERAHNTKNILLGSIFLQGKKIINVRNNHTFLLEFFMFGGEFSFITSFNNDAAVMTIDLLDEKTGQVTQYKFTQKNGQIVLETIDRAATTEDKNSDYRVRIFRPSRPTNVILVHPKDQAELEKTIDVSKHTVLQLGKHNFDAVVEELTKQNFKAVTLFAKSKFRNETKEEKQRYDRVVDKLRRRFQIVFKLHLEGKVEKVQY